MSEPLPPDPYKALGVPVNAELGVIRSAHRKLVLKCHPDKVKDEALKAIKQAEFEKVQRAYELLSDASRREGYDRSVGLAELRKEMMEQPGLPRRTAPPTRRAESYESGYETRRSPSGLTSGLRHHTVQDEKARDRKAREEAERARELRDKDRRRKERSMDNARRKEEEEEKNRGKYRSAYVEDDDSDEPLRRPSARKQPRSEKSYKISPTLSPSPPPPSFARAATYRTPPPFPRAATYSTLPPLPRAETYWTPPPFPRAETFRTYADSQYIVRQIPDEPPNREDDDDSDSYVPLSTKEKETEGEIKLRNEWMQSVFALKSAGAPPEESQDPKETVDTSKDAETEKKPAKVMLTSVPPTQLGIKVMNPETTDPSIDIIAVHGLGAIPEFTWKAKGTGVNWLSDSRMLPPAVPEARIMRFGYDSLWLGKTPVRTRLGIIADKLLLHLGKERDGIPNPKRPLIFIGHCFGGLVIQRALITAKLEENTYRNIFQSSVGVVFLGTPHRGSKSFLAEGELRTRIEMRNNPKRVELSLPQGKLLAQILSKSDLRQGIEPGVLDEMRSDNGTLLTDSEFFSRLCRSNELLVTSFFEQRGSDLLKTIGDSGPEEFIVPEESAIFDSHTNIGLPLDHFSLNKFSDPQDGNFKEVCWEVTKMYQAAKRKLLSGRPDSSGANKEAPSRLRRQIAPSVSLKRSFYELQEEENLRKLAMEEISQEEADKLAAAKEEEFEKKYQERLAAEKKTESEQAESETEKRYKDRWLVNMKKYRVQDAQKILDGDSLPNNSDLTAQEIKDKLRWYKNRIKASLRERGVPGGIVDEILNDMAGDTMEIDGERTTFTKMALKWVDLKTLNRYDVPYILDKDDPSVVIITRWVPEYEQEFFWDHSYKLRQKAKERKQRPSKKKVATTRTTLRATGLGTADYAPEYMSGASPKTKRAETPYIIRYAENPYESKHTYPSYVSPYDPEPSPRRGRKDSGTRSRHASTESIRSAPDYEAVARMHQQSRTLSEERPASVQRHSYDGGRGEGRYASDGETGRRSSGIMSGIKKKVFGQRSSDDERAYSKRAVTYDVY